MLSVGLADAGSLDNLRLGGTEEAIIDRGTDWCTDLARVACVLCQIAGVPARVVQLFRIAAAYSGHVIVEVLRNRRWGSADVVHGVVYRHPDGRPTSAWDLAREPDLIAAHWPGRGPSKVEQFQGAAIVNYFVWEADKFDYTVSAPNAYCRSIVEKSERGWPRGLMWLHGEDRIHPKPAAERSGDR